MFRLMEQKIDFRLTDHRRNMIVVIVLFSTKCFLLDEIDRRNELKWKIFPVHGSKFPVLAGTGNFYNTLILLEKYTKFDPRAGNNREFF